MQLSNIRWLVPIVLLITSCTTPTPPTHMDNICHIFKQYPEWYKDTKVVAKHFGVPIYVQMAIIHQESHFQAEAKPPCSKVLWVIPWSRPSTAYGYSQALDGTWALYKNSVGRFWASRTRFYDAVHFVGWYSQNAHVRAGIAKNNAYALYLAYHEGVTGYQKRTYLKKKWLILVAKKVQLRASIYQAQLRKCKITRTIR